MPKMTTLEDMRNITKRFIEETDNYKKIQSAIYAAASKGFCEVKVPAVTKEEGSLLRSCGFHIYFDATHADGHIISWLFKEK